MAYFDRGGKRAITVWHRRAGKDVVAAHHTCKAAHLTKGVYWHFFPTFAQARRSLWEGFTKDGKRIMEWIFPGFTSPDMEGSVVARKNDQQMFLELKCGSVWRLMGTDNAEIVGAGPQGVVFSEFALCRPTVWDLVRPMLRESGGWAWFITTPRGRNHAHQLYEAATPERGWYRDLQTVRDTGLTYSSNVSDARLGWEEMVDEERLEGMDEGTIEQEYHCSFTAATRGTIFADLVEKLTDRGGVAEFVWDGQPIFTSWDIGFTDSTGLWWWCLNADGGVDVLDHYEASGQPLSHYLDEVDSRGWTVNTHFLPHDARAKTLVTGTSIMEEADKHWPGKVQLTPGLSIADGITAARALLQKPTRIHTRCTQGLSALRHYRYPYDEDTKAYGKKPMHDWSSHSCDAFRYLAVVHKAASLLLPAAPQPKRLPDPTKPVGFRIPAIGEKQPYRRERV